VKAVLLLEDGKLFEGKAFGAKGKKCGEVVFNTAMSGYQEVLTDPSYHEQIVTMTYPLIGNYGSTPEDCESAGIFVSGFIVKENCPFPSNWRNTASLDEYLKENNIIGLEDIDTRSLVKHIREKGAMKGIISSSETDIEKLQAELDEYPGLMDRDIVQNVTTDKNYKWDEGILNVETGEQVKPETKYKVVAVDYGIKYNILRLLRSYGCEVDVVTAKTPAEDILEMNPDGVFLGNGPGDPDPLDYAVETTKKLLGEVPIFGICLGHQILGLAMGGERYKLSFGHHGANHPVKNLKTRHIEITSQNHGFCIDIDSLDEKEVKPTHINLNDQTLEGFKCKNVPAFCVQYHPEASPGPHDSQYLFEEFTKLMDKSKKGKE
jgi:carbamoyl-phosphate synthase small subunit